LKKKKNNLPPGCTGNRKRKRGEVDHRFGVHRGAGAPAQETAQLLQEKKRGGGGGRGEHGSLHSYTGRPETGEGKKGTGFRRGGEKEKVGSPTNRGESGMPGGKKEGGGERP